LPSSGTERERGAVSCKPVECVPRPNGPDPTGETENREGEAD